MTAHPYPGLRPFNPEEVDIFFGREAHVDQLLEKLGRQRFLGVVGTSGCGKSSLVRAGMIPALETGFLPSAGSRWRVAEMRPGDRPLTRLAEALLGERALEPERGEGPMAQGLLLAGLRRGPLALVETLADTPLPSGTNLLVLVDQFEEVFRYHRYGDRDEADAFVALLLATVTVPDLPVYVVLTMRSDFLGDCALFAGLPEALNESQFLTPRLDRSQREASIVGPAGVFGGRVAPALVNRLLNDMGDEPDQLPLMQHVLMRLWNEAQGSMTTTAHGIHVHLTVEGYEAVGGFRAALSRHAEEAFAELDATQQLVAERMFRALTERGEGDRDIRRPVRLGAVASIADVEPEAVAAVVEVFRRPDRSFLTPPKGTPLDADTLLDVSHESLIRQWERLTGWVEREARSAETYHRLAETARLWADDKAGLWGSPDLELATEWRTREQPTAAWAERYEGNFAAAMRFLDASQRKREDDRAAAEHARIEAERQLKIRKRSVLLTIGLVLVSLFAVWSIKMGRQAKGQSQLAEAAFLISQANAQVERIPEHSLLLAVEALRMMPGEDTPNARAVREVLHLAINRTQGEVLVGHEASVFGVAVSPDGRWLASAAADRTILIWDLAQLDAPPVAWDGYGDVAGVLAISPDSRWLASGARNDVIRVRSLADPRAEGQDRTLEGHTDNVTSLAWSADGRHLLSGSEDGTARWWPLDEPTKAPAVLGEAQDSVGAVAISPDGRWLIAGSDDNRVRVWRSDDLDAAPRVLAGHQGPVRALAFDHTGRWLATGSDDNDARLWRVGDDEIGPALVLQGHQNSVRSLAFDPDGRFLVTGSHDDTARRWDLDAAADGVARGLAFVGHTGAVHAVAVSPDGRHLVTISDDKSARIWDLHTTEPVPLSLALTGHGEPALALALMPDGQRFVTGSFDQTLRVWPLEKADQHTSSLPLSGGLGAVSAVAFSRDGRWLATASEDNSARLWDLAASNLSIRPRTLYGHASSINTLAFTPDGRWLVTGGEDNTAHIWDTSTADSEAVTVLRGHRSSIVSLAITEDGRWLGTASRDGTARLWAFDEPAAVPPPVVLDAHGDSLTALAFDATGTRVATASEDTLARVWAMPDGPRGDGVAVGDPIVLRGHEDDVTAIIFRPNHDAVITGGVDATVRVWDLAADDPSAGARILHGHRARITSLSIDQIGARLVSGSVDHTARLWQLTDPDPAATSHGLFGHAADVTQALVGPFGEFALTASADATVLAWDFQLDPPQAVAELRGHRGPIVSLASSFSGLALATGSIDQSARLWRTRLWTLSLDQLVDRACAAAGRNLSEAQWRQYLPNQPYRVTCPGLPVPQW